jgi:hypothetical protein
MKILYHNFLPDIDKTRENHSVLIAGLWTEIAFGISRPERTRKQLPPYWKFYKLFR